MLFLCLPSDLRVFPERYVVCVSCLEDASAHHGNSSLAAVSAVYTPLFRLPATWQKVLHGSVCYYRDVLPNCPLNLYILILFAWGRGLLTCQGFLVREGEWQGVGWCEVGPKAAASPLLEMLLRGHSANSPQLWVTFCQTQTWYCCKPQHEWEVKKYSHN